MRNIYAVLQQKEAEIESLRMELRALHVVASLLEEHISEERTPGVTLMVRPHESVPEDALVVSAANSKSIKWWQL